jgi:amino acid adenylation domain-containing protein
MNSVLHALLEQAADEYPHRPALADRGRELTYLELDQRANQVAHLLRSRGVRPGDRVGLYLEKSLEAVVGLYGVLKAGGAYVPIDARAPTARAGYIAGDCGIETLISAKKQAALWLELIDHGAPLQTIIAMDGTDSPLAGPELVIPDDGLSRDRLATPVRQDDLAYILYTSGSTGQPKGVMLSHGNGLAFVEWTIAELSISAEDRLSSHAPFHFDLSIFDLFAAAGAGASVSLVPPPTSVFPIEVARFIRDNKISIWYSVPSILSLLIQNAPLAQGDFPSLRAMVFAGEVFPSKYLSLLMRRLPHVTFHNWYGPTETNVCTSYPVDFAPDPLGPDIPIGKAIKGVDTFVITADGRRAGAGEEGELLVGGPTVMRGYWGDPEKTATRLVANPLEPLSSTLVYQTGDLVVEEPDGNYRFLGRRDHQIKSRGYRIELGEIETALNAHPGVVECAALAVPDEVISNRIEAYLVMTGDEDSDLLTAWCASRIPRYMIPEKFIFLDALPKTSTGKTDRQALQSLKGTLSE